MHPPARDRDHVLAHTAAVWDELKDARIFLTGGTGFFGCWLLETLLWANDRLRLNASVAQMRSRRKRFLSRALLTASPKRARRSLRR